MIVTGIVSPLYSRLICTNALGSHLEIINWFMRDSGQDPEEENPVVRPPLTEGKMANVTISWSKHILCVVLKWILLLEKVDSVIKI